MLLAHGDNPPEDSIERTKRIPENVPNRRWMAHRFIFITHRIWVLPAVCMLDTPPGRWNLSSFEDFNKA